MGGGVMKRHKPLYHHISDYPLFRAAGLVLTAAIFFIGYWSIEFTYGIGISSLAGMSVPCALVMLWGYIKQRDLWIPWAVFAVPCLLALSLIEEEGLVTLIISHAYWVGALVTCCVLALAWSKSERRARDFWDGKVKLAPMSDDPVKDAFLEELFQE